MRNPIILLTIALLAAPAAARAQCDLPRIPAAGDSVQWRYGETASWYTNHESARFRGRAIEYGQPRVLSRDLLMLAGDYSGVPMYVERDVEGPTGVFYALLNSRCEFQPYQSLKSIRQLRPAPAAAADALPAWVGVSGCPRGARLFIFPAAELAADPAWRSKLVPGDPHYLGEAEYYHLLVSSATPQPYDVVLTYRGRAWRYRVDAIPGRDTFVEAKPPHMSHCAMQLEPRM